MYDMLLGEDAPIDCLAHAHRWRDENQCGFVGVFQKIMIKPFKKVFP